ncbi:MAG: ABC transporter ATP-binding protein [Rhodospirillales bacterium]
MGFFSIFSRLPNAWGTLALIVLSGMAEGFGLVLFVPLLELMTGGSAEDLKWPFTVITDVFGTVGLPITLNSMLVSIAVLILGSLGLGYAQRHLAFRAKHQLIRRLRRDLMDALFHATWSHFTRQSHGEVINQLIQESHRAGNASLSAVLCVATVIQVTLYLLFSAMLSWELMTITLLYTGFVVLAVRPLQRRARVLGEANTRANRDMGFYGVDFLRGAKLVKVTTSEGRVLDRIADHIRAVFHASFHAELNGVQIYFLVQALPVVLIAGIIAVAHGALGITSSLTLVFLLILARLAPRVAQLQQQYQGYNVARPAMRVVDEAIAAGRANQEDLGGGKRLARLSEGITLNNVSYHYADGEETVVDGVSLTIGRNQMIAVVGSSGAGKSTLIDLIAGLRVPDSGNITVDGVDLREMNLRSWRCKIGYVTQDVMVFNDTMRNNLVFTHSDSTEDDIRRVVDITHLRDVVEGLPQGLDTVLGEGGVRLSGGQKQRLALARALVGDPELLLLDEATSALDTQSERMIQKAVESIAHKFTIVIVAHRLSTVSKADRICVMEGGRIVESGSYDELLAQNGRFAELHEHQFA